MVYQKIALIDFRCKTRGFYNLKQLKMNPGNYCRSLNPSNQSGQSGQALDGAVARYKGGVLFQSPLHQSNNEAVDVAQNPEVPTQIKGKEKA